MKNKGILLLTMFILLSGCSGISSRMQESDIDSKLQTNGVYINKVVLSDNKGVRVNTVRFIKGKINKIKYITKVVNQKGKVISDSELEESYRIRCYRDDCEVRFSEYTKTMILDYKINVNKNGSLYFGSMADKFLFKKDM